MATANPFDLLGDGDIEDPSLFIAAQEKKAAAAATGGFSGGKKAPAAAPVASGKAAKLPTKPLPPSQSVRESRNETGRGGGGRGGRGYGRGRGPSGANRDLASNESTFANDNGISTGFREDKDRPFERPGGFGGSRGGFRGGRRSGFGDNEAAEGERPRRFFERRSGTGRGNDFKREGSGRGNWGTPTDEIAPEVEEVVAENEGKVAVEKQSGEENVDAAEKENPATETEDKEPEEVQMTLEEYEKVLEEKRKALLALKSEERKVDVDKELMSMQLVSKKNTEEEIFIKLGSDKDKKKDALEKEERSKKSVSINDFLKPAEGESYQRSGGRGRGRGGRGGNRGGGYGGGGYGTRNVAAPSIEDASQFPSLGAK